MGGFGVTARIRSLVMNKHFVALTLLVFMTACTSVEERQAHVQGQIDIVRSQADAKTDQKAAEAMAKAELYKALAQVAMANPEQASAVTVALAVQGVGAEGSGDDTRVVPLQPMVNEGLEFAKVFAAPLANVTTAVATAYINADVAKTQSDNAAMVQINDALQDSRIVEAVAGVGIAAAESSGLMVSGDNYTLSDSSSISQDQTSTVATTTTTTTETTETISTSTLNDSYNTTDNSTDNTDNSVVTYGGQEWTVRGLVEFFQSTGEPYVLTVGDNTYTDTDASNEGQTCVPTFDGYVCTGA
jgi:hypothetical protein